MASSILITAATSSPTLSKSGKHAFSITLSATTDTKETITIDPFQTMLGPAMAVFNSQGFTFKDTSGNSAARRDLCVMYAEREYVVPGSVVEIPARNAERPFTVTHSMTFARPIGPSADQKETEMQQMFEDFQNQAAGFEVGQTCEIGLGEDWNAVWWWRVGTKSEVFGKNAKLSASRMGEKLPLVLLNKATFEVVE